ncbi:hypothetical protein ACTFIU_002487 [Dictyostelium citrinum]
MKLAVVYMDKHVHFERVATVDGIIIGKVIMSLEFYTAIGVIVLVYGSYIYHNKNRIQHDEMLVTKVKGLIGVTSFLGNPESMVGLGSKGSSSGSSNGGGIELALPVTHISTHYSNTIDVQI